MSQQLKNVVDRDITQYIESAFTRVQREHIDSRYIVKVKGGEFACDDYAALYKMLFGNSADSMEIYRAAKELWIAKGRTGLSNQAIADIIEGTLWVPDADPDTGYQFKLEGYWLSIIPQTN